MCVGVSAPTRAGHQTHLLSMLQSYKIRDIISPNLQDYVLHFSESQIDREY